nr:immunoglobulin heavy chain junction region [Macaca mulatta]
CSRRPWNADYFDFW